MGSAPLLTATQHTFVFILSFLMPGMICATFGQEAMPMSHEHHMHMDDNQHAPPGSRHGSKTTASNKPKTVHHGQGPSSIEHGAMHHDHQSMKGFFGPYPMNREGSGTSWLPDTTPHEGIYQTYADWMLMEHALVNGVYDSQGGLRGRNKSFVGGMLMGMAERSLGDGTFGLKAMVSPDPFMGPSGYPLLLATGETANGRTPLIDRQHPHDLFMELSSSYSYNLSANSSVFLYAGLPGEPALGPSAFMHRTSGMDIPEAPISHHWLDSTHITYGVLTFGYVMDNWKLDASAFRGREPDQYRFDIEQPGLDSVSTRLSWNPTKELSMQVSWGHLHSPEKLAPDVNETRITASVIYTQPFGDNNIWSSTLAWGRKMNSPGNTLDAFLFESGLIFKQTYTLFLRAERVAEDELLEDLPSAVGSPSGIMPIFTVNKITLGGIYDFPIADHLKFGIGALVSKYGLPGDLNPFYGSDPTSYMLFLRLKLS
jgi:hypothetical protein